MARKTQKAESKNCFLKPISHQYKIKRICTISTKGTIKLNTDSNGNDFGDIYGIAKEARNNNANTLLIKKIILFMRDKFFNYFIFFQFETKNLFLL